MYPLKNEVNFTDLLNKHWASRKNTNKIQVYIKLVLEEFQFNIISAFFNLLLRAKYICWEGK